MVENINGGGINGGDININGGDINGGKCFSGDVTYVLKRYLLVMRRW